MSDEFDDKKCYKLKESFCHVCGEYIEMPRNKRSMTDTLKETYQRYFNRPVNTTPSCPSQCCALCHSTLLKWRKGEPKYFPFKTPMKWLSPRNCAKDCYVCLTKFEEIDSRTIIKYPENTRTKCPILRDNEEEPPKWSEVKDAPRPHSMSQEAFDDIVEDLNLDQDKAEFLFKAIRKVKAFDRGVNAHNSFNLNLNKY